MTREPRTVRGKSNESEERLKRKKVKQIWNACSPPLNFTRVCLCTEP